MHERTERTLCRLAFLVLCALPTFLTFAFTCVSKTPWYHRAEIASLEILLTQRLGVDVKIGDMQRPSPGAWQLEQVVLSDPESGSEVASVRTVLYADVDGEIRLHLSQPAMRSDQLSLVWRVVHERFLCQPDLLGERLRLRAQDLSILSNPQGLTLSPVDVWILPGEEETSAKMQFSMIGGNEQDQPATLTVTRIRGTNEKKPSTRWELQTGSRPLPCSVLADYLPAMRRLGIDAEFSGLLTWEVDRDDYFVQLQGATFSNVNMLDLTEHFEDHVSGRGTIKLQNLIRYGGRPVSQANGKLTIENGKLEQSLLRKLAATFQANLQIDQLGDRERIDCQMVAVEFRMHGQDVELAGVCYRQPTFEAMPPGTAIVARDIPLLQLDRGRRFSSDRLTVAFDPQGRVGLPVGKPVDWAQRVLPNLGNSSEPVTGPPQAQRLRLNR